MTTWVEDENTYQRLENSKGNLNGNTAQTPGYYFNKEYTFNSGDLNSWDSDQTNISGTLYRKFVPDRWADPNHSWNGYQDMSQAKNKTWNEVFLQDPNFWDAGVSNANVGGNNYTGYYAKKKTIQISSGSIEVYQGWTPPHQVGSGNDGSSKANEVSWFEWRTTSGNLTFDPSMWYHFKPDGTGYIEFSTSEPQNSVSEYTYEKYVKRIVDISGKNNHLYIGPYKSVYPYMNAPIHGQTMNASIYPDQEYYGTNTPYTYYNNNKQLGKDDLGNDLPSSDPYYYHHDHPDYNLNKGLRGANIHQNWASKSVTFKDGTTGLQSQKYWTSNRWHEKQLEAWNAIPMKKNPINLKSFIGDEMFDANSSLENTIQHYPGSASLVTQFSDAQQYDWNSSYTNDGTKIVKRNGISNFTTSTWGAFFNGGIQYGYEQSELVVHNYDWQTNQNKYDNPKGNDKGNSWLSSQNNFKITWKDPILIGTGGDYYYVMFGTASWSIKYNYGTSISTKTVFASFATTLNTILDEYNNTITVSLDLGDGAENCLIYRATQTIYEDGIPFINKAYYVMSQTTFKIARVEATGRKFTNVDLVSFSTVSNYGHHEFTGYYPDDIDSIFSINTNTGNADITVYSNPDNTGTAVSNKLSIYVSNTTKYLDEGGYFIDGVNDNTRRLQLWKDKLYTFDVSEVKNSNRFAFSTSSTTYDDPNTGSLEISDIWSNSDTITIKSTSQVNTLHIINLGSSTSNSPIIKDNYNIGMRTIKISEGGGWQFGGDFEITTHELIFDFTAHKTKDTVTNKSTWRENKPFSQRFILPEGVINQWKEDDPTFSAGFPPGDPNRPGSDATQGNWSPPVLLSRPEIRRLGDATNWGNTNADKENGRFNDQNTLSSNHYAFYSTLNKPWSYIIGVTKKVNLDLWHDSSPISTLLDIAYKRQEYILSNKENDANIHNPPRVLGNANLATQTLSELKDLLARDDFAVARHNLVYKISEGVKYNIGNITYGGEGHNDDDGVSIVSNQGKTFSDYLQSVGPKYMQGRYKNSNGQYANNAVDYDEGDTMKLAIDTNKLRNVITPNSKGEKYAYFFIWFQDGGVNLEEREDQNGNQIRGYLPYEPIYTRNNISGDDNYIKDIRFGRILLNNAGSVLLNHPNPDIDTNLVKGILINKYAARFAHPVGQYGFDNNIINKGEGIKTFYMICEFFPHHWSDPHSFKQMIPLFDTACPDHYPVEVAYKELIQKFHIKVSDSHFNTASGNYYHKSDNFSGTSHSLQEILLCAYLKVLGYLRFEAPNWYFGYYQSDGNWVNYDNNHYICDLGASKNSFYTNNPIERVPNTTDNQSGSTFSIIQRIDTNYNGHAYSNPNKALNEAKKCDANALQSAIFAITHPTTGLDHGLLGNYKVDDTDDNFKEISIIKIDQPEYICPPDNSGFNGIQSGSDVGPLRKWKFLNRDDYRDGNDATTTFNSKLKNFEMYKAERLTQFIKSKAELNYDNSNYWKVDNTGMIDSVSSFGKDLLIHLNKEYGGNPPGTFLEGKHDYHASLSMLPYIDQDMTPTVNGSFPSPDINGANPPDYLTMEIWRKSAKLTSLSRPNPLESHDSYSYETTYKKQWEGGNEVLYELFKQVINSRNNQTKNTFIKEIDYIFRSYLYSYVSQDTDISPFEDGRYVGTSYPKTVDGRKSIWSRGSEGRTSQNNFSDYHRQAVYLNAESGMKVRYTNNTLTACNIWLNGQKNSPDQTNIQNWDSTKGGKIILVYQDKENNIPANGINILGWADGENAGSTKSFFNNIPRIDKGDTYETSSGLGLNYLAMYDTKHSDTEIENNIKYLNKEWKIYKMSLNGDGSTNNWQYDQNGGFPTVANEPNLPGELLFKYKADAKAISGAANIVSAINGFDLKQTDNTAGFDSSITSYKLTVPYTRRTFTKDLLNVTNNDSSQPNFELSGDTTLVEGQEKTIRVKTNSEGRMNIIQYTITVLRQTNTEFAQNKTAAAFGSGQAALDVNNKINNSSINAIKDTSGRLELTEDDRTNLEGIFQGDVGDTAIQKHRKMHAALTLFLVNAKNNNSNFDKNKGLKLSKDTFDSSFISKLKPGITNVVVFPVDAKPDFSGSTDEAAFIPFSDGETFTCSIDGQDISIECITSTENSATGNYTISAPTRNNISKIGGGAINWGTGGDSLKIKNVQYNDSFNIYGKLITIGSVTYGGNSGSVRVSSFDEFSDITTHENQLVKIGNDVYQLDSNVRPNHINNFITDHTFYDSGNNTSYNTQSNIEYDDVSATFEVFTSDVRTEEFNTGNSSITLKNNVIDISNSTFETIDGSIDSTYKSTRDITIKNNNFETHQNLQHSNKANLTVDLHQTLDKYNNEADTKSYNTLHTHSHINKTTNIHTNLDKNLSNNHIINNKKDVNNTFQTKNIIAHQNYNITINNDHNTIVNNNLAETIHLDSNINEIQFSNTTINTNADRYATDLNITHYKSKDVSIGLNETLQLNQQNIKHIYNVDTFSTNNSDSNIGITVISSDRFIASNQSSNKGNHLTEVESYIHDITLLDSDPDFTAEGTWKITLPDSQQSHDFTTSFKVYKATGDSTLNFGGGSDLTYESGKYYAYYLDTTAETSSFEFSEAKYNWTAYAPDYDVNDPIKAFESNISHFSPLGTQNIMINGTQHLVSLFVADQTVTENGDLILLNGNIGGSVWLNEWEAGDVWGVYDVPGTPHPEYYIITLTRIMGIYKIHEVNKIPSWNILHSPFSRAFGNDAGIGLNISNITTNTNFTNEDLITIKDSNDNTFTNVNVYKYTGTTGAFTIGDATDGLYSFVQNYHYIAANHDSSNVELFVVAPMGEGSGGFTFNSVESEWDGTSGTPENILNNSNNFTQISGIFTVRGESGEGVLLTGDNIYEKMAANDIVGVQIFKATGPGNISLPGDIPFNYTSNNYYGFYQSFNDPMVRWKIVLLNASAGIDGGSLISISNSTYTNISEDSLDMIVSKNDLTTFKHDSNVNHKSNHTNTIYGTSSQFVNTDYTNNNKQDQTLVTKDYVSTKYGTNTEFINGESTENYKNTSKIIEGDNNQIIDGSFDLKTTGNILFNSVGGLNISTNIDKSLNLNSNVCIKENVIVSNIPYILNTAALTSYITSEGLETTMLTIDPIYSLVLIALDTNNTLAETYMEQDLYCRVKLAPGKYNGQHIKLVLHPSFQTFFSNVSDTSYNTIDKRVANNIRTDIIVRIESFADVDSNEFITADLILNRGGMCLNLIYVATNTNTGAISTNNVDHYRTSGISATGSGYWMLIGNSFTS